jgi:hypothetical protein
MRLARPRPSKGVAREYLPAFEGWRRRAFPALALRREHKKRLFLLEEQQAMRGSNTPPEILNEITSLHEKIAEVERNMLLLGVDLSI